MPRFSQTFNALYSRLPFKDDARAVLRAFAEAVRREFVGPTASGLNLQDEANAVYDATFIPSASGADLDKWGDVLDLERSPSEPDVNYGVEFFGPATDYINVPYNVSLDVTTQLTVDMRFKVDALGSTRIVYSRSNSDQEIFILATGAVSWYPRMAVVATSAAGLIAPGTWYHIRCIYDSVTGAQIFLGQPGGVFTLIASAAAGGLMTAGAWPIRIGQRHSGTNPVDGVVDEIRAVAGVVTTVSGVTEVPEYLTAVTGTKLLLHCDEGTGATAFDGSGFNNDGTLLGGAAWYSMVATGWPGFRKRLLVEWQSAAAALTVQSATDAVDDLGATYVPPLAVVRVDEHYKPYWGGAPQQYGRRADGIDPADVTSLGEIWGLEDLDRLTFSVVVDRIPTPAEALALAQALAVVKPAQTRAYVVNEVSAVAPPQYRLRSFAYSSKLAPLEWDDEFYRLFVVPGASDLYDELGAAVGAVWMYTGTELLGDASGGAANTNLLIFPKAANDGYPPVVERVSAYVEASAKFNQVGVGAAGFALRYQLAGDYYALMFRSNVGVWEYIIHRWDSTLVNWVVIKAWTAVPGAPDLANYHDYQIWLEGRYLTFALDGAFVETAFDVGVDITAPGRWGFACFRATAGCDIYVDDWRYW